uniref:Uncharacterized protein n=1 Tax=Timema poppense TaxID=170557 RepID=A0A7R9DQ45_TIMPO|nr:unnamed protein product [Timema poppensis]
MLKHLLVGKDKSLKGASIEQAIVPSVCPRSVISPLQNHQASPRSTPNSSPRSTKSPPLPPSSRSAPPTPGGQLQPSNMMSSLGTGADSLAGVGGDVRSAFGSSTGLIGSSSTSLAGSTSNSAVTNSSGRSLRNDLLVAADSVTNAMSTLVRELNSGMIHHAWQ